ncbi:uncharacterized protein B0H64DRAFT_322726 [Chaetomium fimeti]|uniref:Uncharacterized protein n=1 Tax=Chaetomium fimeti TaxID=1854472 RepID=A0AAE0LS51_9PEZI|nr:hypothetical protein B0H64DRAFT_322726 [Chaetomium fimeti]
MVAEASSPLVDLRAQVIGESSAAITRTPATNITSRSAENCEFFSGTLVRISLVVAKEPLGTFKAIVLKTENGTREAVLAETAPSYDNALKALLIKSAEAVQNYISTNGFALPSSVKKQSPKPSRYDDSHGSDSSTVTLDDCESLSDDETVSITSIGRVKQRRRRKAERAAAKTSSGKHKTRQGRTRSRSPSFSTTRARSRSTCSSSSGYELHYDPPAPPSQRPPFLNAFPQRMPPRPPQNTFSTLPMAPPPPPPPPAGHQKHPPNGFTPTMSMPPPPPPPAPFSFTNKLPPNPPQPTAVLTIPPTSPTTNNNNNSPTHHNLTTTTPQTTRDLILHIRWRHHGERRTLEQIPTGSPITARRLQQAALAFVRRQPAAFAHHVPAPVPSGGGIPPPRPHLPMGGLRAAVRAVVVDGVVCDVGQWVGDDLGRVVEGLRMNGGGGLGGGLAAAAGMVRFEVEVWNEGFGVGVGGGGGGAAAAAAAGSVSGWLASNGRAVTGLGSPGGGGGGSHGVGGSGPGPRMVFPSPGGMASN